MGAVQLPSNWEPEDYYCSGVPQFCHTCGDDLEEGYYFDESFPDSGVAVCISCHYNLNFGLADGNS